MQRSIMVAFLVVFAAAFVFLAVSPVMSQDKDKPADNMQILLDKVKADKKLLVAANMELTESEAKGFWPIYDEYQKELAALNKRIGALIDSYAADYNADTLSDAKAQKLTDEFVAIGKAEGGLQASFAPKLSKVLPPKKVVRYLQIENKIRALIKYELAAEVPLVM